MAVLPYTFSGRRETERLVLRPYVDDDLAILARLHGDPGVTRWLYWDARGLDEVRTVLARKVAELTLAGDGDAISLAVDLRETGETVGDAVVILTSGAHEQAEVGYLIDPAHQGHGYATETAKALLEIALGDVQLHRACGRIEPRNVASGRVLERAGMRHEGTLRENEFIKGEWQSEGVYALLRTEWAERRAG